MTEVPEGLTGALPLAGNGGGGPNLFSSWTLLLLAGATIVLFSSSRVKESLLRFFANFGIAFALWFSNLMDRIFGHGTFQRLLWFGADFLNRRASKDYFTVAHFVKEAEARSGLKANFEEYEQLAVQDGIGSRSGGMAGALEALVNDFKKRERTVVLPFGVVKEQLVRWIQSRIMVNNYIIQNPQVRTIPIVRPLIITGLWRTGTTLLYSLIAQDPKGRSPQLWEIQKPIPPPTKDIYKTDPRIQDVARDVSAVDLITSRDHKHIHDLIADAPEECAFVFFMDCLVFNHLLNERLPDYVEYLHKKHDMQSSYNFYKRMLQVYASNYPPEDHFTLKSPYPHLYHLDILLKTFPDACVVVCHRNPFKCIPSMMSLNTVFSKAFWKDFDPKNTSRHTLNVLAKGAKDSTDFRDSLSPEYDREHFFDCYFEDFIKDPSKMVRRIYDHFGYSISEGMEKNMERYLKEQGQSHNNTDKHKYTLETFGLDNAAVYETFGDYIKRHNYAPPSTPSSSSSSSSAASASR